MFMVIFTLLFSSLMFHTVSVLVSQHIQSLGAEKHCDTMAFKSHIKYSKANIIEFSRVEIFSLDFSIVLWRKYKKLKSLENRELVDISIEILLFGEENR